MLNWRTVTQSNDPKFLVKGTELANAIVPDTLSRYQICEIRCYDDEGFADRCYMIRDAETVTDGDIRAGVRARLLHGRFDTLDVVLAHIDRHLRKCS